MIKCERCRTLHLKVRLGPLRSTFDHQLCFAYNLAHYEYDSVTHLIEIGPKVRNVSRVKERVSLVVKIHARRAVGVVEAKPFQSHKRPTTTTKKLRRPLAQPCS